MVTNQLDRCQLDMRQKMAQYNDRHCNLNHEFSFAHPMATTKVNNIYNCQFSSFQVWNLFSPGAASLERTFNRSVKIMADLPFPTHRYLIEPLGRNSLETIDDQREPGKCQEVFKTCSKTDVKQMLGQVLGQFYEIF